MHDSNSTCINFIVTRIIINNNNIVIFPTHYVSYNIIINTYVGQSGVARLAARRIKGNKTL